MNLTDKENPLLFSLPYTIDYADQKKILDYAYAHAGSWSGQVQVWNKQTDQHEQTDYFGRVQITRLTKVSSQHLGQQYHSDWSNWAGRLDPNLEWEWIDTPVTELVKNYVDQVTHLYHRFHRVLLLIQKVGSDIPLHTDKVIKNTYNNDLFAPGPANNLPIPQNDLHWSNNRYMSLKWPLTEIPGDNGQPVIKIDQQLYRYNAKNHCFAINEVDIEHGAKAASHHRGVIFMDGLLDYNALKQESWHSVELTALTG